MQNRINILEMGKTRSELKPVVRSWIGSQPDPSVRIALRYWLYDGASLVEVISKTAHSRKEEARLLQTVSCLLESLPN